PLAAAKPTATTVAPVTAASDTDPPTSAAADTTTTSTIAVEASLPPPPSRPVRVVVVGDSTAATAAEGLARWQGDHRDYAQVSALWCVGCGFILDGEVTTGDSQQYVPAARDLVLKKGPNAIATLHPDELMLMTTVTAISDLRWSDDEGSLSPRDPRFQQHMFDQYTSLVNTILAGGVPHVVWIIAPVPQ